MYEKHFELDKSVHSVLDGTDSTQATQVKRTTIYLEWLKTKTDLVTLETLPLNVPDPYFPKILTSYLFGRLDPSLRTTLLNYYNILPRGDYKRNALQMTAQHKRDLVGPIVFKHGNVVWVEFGFNIGREFGGKHPAIILKNLGEVLIVAPLSSGQGPNRQGVVNVPLVFDLPSRDRYTDVTRITPISIYRVDLSSFGSVHSTIMTEIKNKVCAQWV